MTKMFFPLAVLSALTLSAQDMDEEMSLDEDGKGVSLFAEAEDFRLADGWQACEAPQYAERGKVGHLWPWYKDIKKAPHLASALKYAAGDAGAATHTFDLPHNGVWRVWVRQGRKGAVAVNGRKLEGMRPEPGDWGWAMRDVEAKKGPFEVKLTAAEKGAAADCVVVTDDRKYEPDIRDFRKFSCASAMTGRTRPRRCFRAAGISRTTRRSSRASRRTGLTSRRGLSTVSRKASS